MLSRRKWLESLGLGGAAVGLSAIGVRADGGDPEYAGFNSRISKIPPSLTDVPSATLDNGKVIQPARELPVFQMVDVVVVGGGPAGWGAAMGAARTGAKVALVERDSSLGGLWTNGGVLLVIGTGVRENNRFKMVTRGMCLELLNRLQQLSDHSITPRYAEGETYQPTTDPEATKMLMDQMLIEAKVDVYFHALGVDVIQVGNAIKGVVFESKEGRKAILAKTVVDASGDGDVYFQAGETYQQITHGMGFVYRVGNSDHLPKQAKVSRGAVEPVKAARWHNNLGPKGNGLDVRELSKIEMEHRKIAWDAVEKMRKTEGCSDAFMMQTCPLVGVRATRLLDGVAQVSKKTAADLTKFNDVVAVSGHDGLRLPEFQIPYGALLPKKIDNLLVAGRCISTSPDIVDRVRLIPVCAVTGHAAGVASALAAKQGVTPREVPVSEIQKVLKEQGAYLG
ncbi:MAG: FAD-dependent oxidoreductase [bacterium]